MNADTNINTDFDFELITGTMHDAARRRLNATTHKAWMAANKALIAIVGSQTKANTICRHFVGR